MSTRYAVAAALALCLTAAFAGARPLVEFDPAHEAEIVIQPAAARAPAGINAVAVAQPLADSFFIFNRRATKPAATYTPGKIGVPIELGIYLLSAGASGPTGTVTITLGSVNCMATMVPEDQSVLAAFNVRGSRGYCTLTPAESGSVMLSGTYSGDADNLGGTVGQFISTSNPLVPILAANGKVNPLQTHFVATPLLPDFAIAGDPSSRWIAFTGPIQGTPPSAAAITITAGAQVCTTATPAARQAFIVVSSERGSYSISYPIPIAACDFTYAQTGYVDIGYAFAGDANYVAGSESAPNEVYVLPAGSKYPVLVALSVASANLPLVRGAVVPITAAVGARRLNLALSAPPHPSGTVTIRVGNASCSGQLSPPTAALTPRVVCSVTVPMTGDLAINATYSGDALYANGTAAPIAGGSPSTGTTTYSGSTPGGTPVTATITASGETSTCTFTGAQFVPVSGDPRSPASLPPAGIDLAQGLFDFKTNTCMNGDTPGSITVTLTFPSAIPAGTVYYKYGPTASNPVPHWYLLPSIVSGNAISFTIVDGSLGDDDLSWNGSITDLGGPASLPGLDLDLDGTSNGSTDGLLLLRHLFGIAGTALTANALGAGAWLSTPAAVAGRIDTLKPLLDVDGNGNTDALTDGMILYRYMLGLRGDAMIQGAVAAGASRSTSTAITAYIDGLLQPPTVTSVTPQDGATGVALGTSVTIVFSKPMQPATITRTPNSVCTGSVQLSIDDFVSCIPLNAATPSAGNTTFTLSPTVFLDPVTVYKVRVTTDAQSASGVPLLDVFTQPNGFTTGN